MYCVKKSLEPYAGGISFEAELRDSKTAEALCISDACAMFSSKVAPEPRSDCRCRAPADRSKALRQNRGKHAAPLGKAAGKKGTPLAQKKDLTGLRSGRVTALEATEQKYRGSTLWRCRCDCGREMLLEPYRILNGSVKSCGCQRGEKRILDLTGQRFGRLTALERLDEKSGKSYLWRCRCDCGRELKVRATALTTGNTTICGCARTEALHGRAKDITGCRFGALTALRPTQERRRGSVLWECRCDCGRTVRYSHNELRYAGVTSCGCRRYSARPLNLRYVDGTCVEALERNDLRRDNTSGHTGVVKLKNGWSARIGFKGRSYYLGCYRDYDLAVAAREQAEEQLHHAFLDWYYQTYPSQEHKRKQTPSAAGTGYAAAAGEDPGFQLQGASQTVV